MADRPQLARTLIVGNSGSGKTWLSLQLAAVLGTHATGLDAIHWEPGSYAVPRDRERATAMVRQAAAGPSWVIEGVYGWLAQEAAARAGVLVWLDVPVAECLHNLRQRGLERDGEQAASEALLAWAAEYPHRQTSSSRAGHGRMFAASPRQGFRLSSRTDVSRFLAEARCAGQA